MHSILLTKPHRHSARCQGRSPEPRTPGQGRSEEQTGRAPAGGLGLPPPPTRPGAVPGLTPRRDTTRFMSGKHAVPWAMGRGEARDRAELSGGRRRWLRGAQDAQPLGTQLRPQEERVTRKGPAWDQESPWGGHVSMSACGWEDRGALSGCPQLGGGLSLQEGGWLVTQLLVHGDRSSWQEGPAPGQPHTCQLEPGVCCLCPFAFHTLTEGSCV